MYLRLSSLYSIFWTIEFVGFSCAFFLNYTMANRQVSLENFKLQSGDEKIIKLCLLVLSAFKNLTVLEDLQKDSKEDEVVSAKNDNVELPFQEQWHFEKF